MLRNKGYTLDIVRVGAALYGQQETVPGTRSAARWLSRIVSLKQVSAPRGMEQGCELALLL